MSTNLSQLSDADLRLELSKREALRLKTEHEKRLAIGTLVWRNRATFADLAKQLGQTELAQQLSDLTLAEKLSYSADHLVTFAIADDPSFGDQTREPGHSGKFIWEKFEPSFDPAKSLHESRPQM